MDEKPLFQGVYVVSLPVESAAAAGKWYADVLGLPRTFENQGMVGFRAGDVLTLVLSETDRKGGAGGVPIFRAADLDAARASLARAGVAVSQVLSHGKVRWIEFHDPDGNRLEASDS